MPAVGLSNKNRLLAQTRMSRNLCFPRGTRERGSQAPALPDSPSKSLELDVLEDVAAD